MERNPLVAKELERLNLKLADLEYRQFVERDDWRYCPYCGNKLEGKLPTVEGSVKICKYALCPKSRIYNPKQDV